MQGRRRVDFEEHGPLLGGSPPSRLRARTRSQVGTKGAKRASLEIEQPYALRDAHTFSCRELQLALGAVTIFHIHALLPPGQPCPCFSLLRHLLLFFPDLDFILKPYGLIDFPVKPGPSSEQAETGLHLHFHNQHGRDDDGRGYAGRLAQAECAAGRAGGTGEGRADRGEDEAKGACVEVEKRWIF